MDDWQKRQFLSILQAQVNILESLVKSAPRNRGGHEQGSVVDDLDRLQINIYQSMEALVDQSGVKRIEGDSFENISEDVVIVNRSVVTGAENALRRTRGDQTADAFRQLVDEVAKADCRDASICLNSLADELLKTPPQGLLVRMLLSEIVKSAPEVGGSVDIVDLQKLP